MSVTISFKPYILQKKHPFRISRGVRTTTPVVITRLRYGNITGFGEASMPPLYGETIESAVKFLKKIDTISCDPLDIETYMAFVDDIDTGNSAVKASVDVALHDLSGKILQKPCNEIIGLPFCSSCETSKTIGIDNVSTIRERVRDAHEFGILKIKLGAGNDMAVINTIRAITDKPLYVDVNQGWKNKYRALDKIKWLSEQGVVFIEQPMPVDSRADMAWLKSRSPLPLIGDESIQRMPDMKNADEFFHGVNIKLMKSTGLNEAVKMVDLAGRKNLKILIGCMSETSCGISAAYHLSGKADYIDLDGNLGITNDPFSGVETVKGTICGNRLPGIGLINPDLSWSNIHDDPSLC